MNAPQIQARRVDPAVEREAIALGLDPVLARIVAGRLTSRDGPLRKLLAPTLSQLDDPRSLSNIDKAAARLARAITKGEHIGLATDHDADGVTSCAVFKEALTCMFGVTEDRISLFISHRLREGYGLNTQVVKRILAAKQRPSLIITADKGSSDERRIAVLAAAGIDVIVSDHHDFPVRAGKLVPPPSAYAVVSPKHPEGKYPDDKIAGCMVAWLVVAHTHRILAAAQKISADQGPLKELLTYVAIGTVADCVSLGHSYNNRAVVREGLKRIRESTRPAWQTLRAHFGANGAPIRTETLAFQICPRLAAAGRMDVAEPGIKFLLAERIESAERWYAFLTEENEARKQTEHMLLNTIALDDADRQAAEDKQTIVVNLGEQGHAGVHGIVASRILELHGCPTVMISPKQGQRGVCSGSCRSVPGVHVREALQWVSDQSPGLFMKRSDVGPAGEPEEPAFGGHVGAAGFTIQEKDVATFAELFERAVRVQLQGRTLGPVRFSDGELPAHAFTAEFLDSMHQLEPWGREFEYPLFEGNFLVKEVRLMGADRTHVSLRLESGGREVRAVWFNATGEGTDELPVVEGDRLRALYELSDNYWKGRRTLQLTIRVGLPQHSPQLDLERQTAAQDFAVFACEPSI